MAFKLSLKPSYAWPVSFTAPDDGEHVTQEFTAEFKRYNQQQIDELFAKSRAGELKDDALVREVLLGWAGVLDDEGHELAWSIKKRDELLAIAHVRVAIVTAFIESLSGGARKN